MRRGLKKMNEAEGLVWLQNHLDYCTTPLLGELLVLDMDSTVLLTRRITAVRDEFPPSRREVADLVGARVQALRMERNWRTMP